MNSQRYYRQTYWDEKRPDHLAQAQDRQVQDLRQILSCHLPPSATVIDIGCGDGTYYGAVVRQHARLHVGVDISASALQRARQVHLQGVILDLQQPLPFRSETFEAAVCIDVLEHLFDPEGLLRQVRTALKREGLVIASVPNIAHLPHRLRLLGGKFVAGGLAETAETPWSDPHIRFFTVRSLSDLLQAAGYRPSRVYGINAALLTRMPILSILLARVFGRSRAKRLSERLEPLGRTWPNLLAGKLVAVAQRDS